MEKSKQCAIEHWHRVNEKPIPIEYRKKTPDGHRKFSSSSETNAFKFGNKRRAPDPDQNSLKSPVKKFADKESMKDDPEKNNMDNNDKTMREENPTPKNTANSSHPTNSFKTKRDSTSSNRGLSNKKPFSKTESSLLPKEKGEFAELLHLLPRHFSSFNSQSIFSLC